MRKEIGNVREMKYEICEKCDRKYMRNAIGNVREKGIGNVSEQGYGMYMEWIRKHMRKGI